MKISPEQLARYRQSARQQQGLQVARQATQLLKQEFGVRRVRLFGSLLEQRRVRTQSDVDLAVEGEDNRYLEALFRLLALSDFSVDLVQMEYAAPKMCAVIDQKGVEW